jgi:hypothetical protein
MIGIIGNVGNFLSSTQVPQQFKDMDPAIFINPYFLVPMGIWIAYLAWKANWRGIILTLLGCGVWYACGTPYMKTLVVDGELQMNKVLPVMFGGAAILGLIIFLYFGSSD